MPGLVAAQPSLSRIKSMDRFKTFWRLYMKSSDWWAKEKEWRDSEGKRERSSLKLRAGEPGPEGSACEAEG